MQSEVDAIYFLDSDNTIGEYALLNAYQDMTKSRVDWVYPDIRVLGTSDFYSLDCQFNPHVLKFRNYSEAGSMISRNILNSGIKFDENMKKGYEDWEYWINLAKLGFCGGHSYSLSLNYRKRFESMVTDSKKSHNEIREYIEKKHSQFFNYLDVSRSENEYCPKFTFIDITSGECGFGSSFEHKKKSTILDVKNNIRQSFTSDNKQWVSDYFIFSSSETLTELSNNGILDDILLKVQHDSFIEDKGLYIFGINSEKNNLIHGVSKIEYVSDLFSCSLICVKRKLYFEIIFDNSSNWFIDQLSEPDTRVSSIYEIFL